MSENSEKIKVYLYCEGVTDIEPLCTMMKRVKPCLEVTVTTRKELKAVTTLLSNRRGTHKRVTFIKRLAMLATKNGSKHIAYHRDGDGDHNTVYAAVVSDFKESAEEFYTLAVVPKEMLESWLLADENAYLQAFGESPTKPPLPKKPENLWGKKDDTNSNYPKHVMKRVLEQYGKAANKEIYACLAEHIDISTMRRKCPESFERFWKDLQEFVQ